MLQVDLHKALSTNASLAEHYRQMQVKFIQAKTLALGVIERKLEMESSLRDHKQVRGQFWYVNSWGSFHFTYANYIVLTLCVYV